MPTKFTIFNDTSTRIDNMRIEYKQAESDRMYNGKPFSSTGAQFVTFQAREHQEITIPDLCYNVPVDLSTCRALLEVSGIQWEGHENVAQSLVDGGEYHVCVDDRCPPLTEEELLRAEELSLALVEGALSAPPPKFNPKRDSTPVPAIWRHIVGELGRDRTDEDIVRKTGGMIMAGIKRDMTSHWGRIYDNHPRRPTISTSAGSPVEVVGSGNYRIDVYHRALDRCPGGNEDIAVIRHTYAAATGKAPSLTTFEFKMFDVNMTIYAEPVPRPDAMAEQFASSVPKALLEAVAGGERDITCTINDPRSDCEELETEWSSIEIMLYDASGNLAARIHQRARLTNDQNVPVSTMPPEAPAPPVVQAALGAVGASLGVGTVMEWCSHPLGNLNAARVVLWDYFGLYAVNPIYLANPWPPYIDDDNGDGSGDGKGDGQVKAAPSARGDGAGSGSGEGSGGWAAR